MTIGMIGRGTIIRRMEHGPQVPMTFLTTFQFSLEQTYIAR